MREDEFQHQLRPRGAADLGRVSRKWTRAEAAEERAAGERAVDDDGDAAIAGEWQKAVLGVTFADGVVDLDEVDGFAGDEPGDGVLTAGGVMRDAEMADTAGGLPVAERGEVGVSIDEIVHLHEVDGVDAEFAQRVFHLFDAGAAAGGPDFRGDEEVFAEREFFGQLAEDLFGTAIHRGGVDDAAAEFRERAKDFFERAERIGSVGDVESLPGAEADGGEFFAGRGDAAGEEWLWGWSVGRSGEGEPGTAGGGGEAGGEETKSVAAVHG